MINFIVENSIISFIHLLFPPPPHPLRSSKAAIGSFYSFDPIHIEICTVTFIFQEEIFYGKKKTQFNT